MKDPHNIYDIDGKLLYDVNNPEELTVESAQKRILEYKEKLDKCEEGSHEYGVYSTYIVNLERYIINKYINNPELYNNLKERVEARTDDAIIKALNELNEENDGDAARNIESEIQRKLSGDSESDADKESGDDISVERTDSDIQEAGSGSQSSVLDEQTVMDEYVNFEEV